MRRHTCTNGDARTRSTRHTRTYATPSTGPPSAQRRARPSDPRPYTHTTIGHASTRTIGHAPRRQMCPYGGADARLNRHTCPNGEAHPDSTAVCAHTAARAALSATICAHTAARAAASTPNAHIRRGRRSTQPPNVHIRRGGPRLHHRMRTYGEPSGPLHCQMCTYGEADGPLHRHMCAYGGSAPATEPPVVHIWRRERATGRAGRPPSRAEQATEPGGAAVQSRERAVLRADGDRPRQSLGVGGSGLTGWRTMYQIWAAFQTTTAAIRETPIAGSPGQSAAARAAMPSPMYVNLIV